ncbi:MAG TPA: MFS transporter [Micropepsaceae bacterium]|nr:MFS transporter [Micropepsaceae bacterium]
MHDSGVQPLPLAVATGAGVRARWLISGLLLVAVTTAFFDRINIAVLFGNKDFQSAIGVSNPAMLGLLMTAFVFPYGASGMLFSAAGDFFGPRRTLSVIAAILAASMLMMGIASSYPLMFAGRVVIGVTEGPQFGTAVATVKRWFPAREQGLANALWTIGSPLGSMFGFPLVIFLVAQYGWRASFFALAALNAFVVLPVIWLYLRDNPPDAAKSLAEKREESVSFGTAFGMLARDWRFWLLPIYNSGTLIYLWGLNSWLPTYLQQARHLNLMMTGFYSALPFALMIVGQIVFAWLGDKTGRRAFLCGITQAITGVLVYFAAIAPDADMAAWLIALSAGFWGGTTPGLFAISSQIVPRKITALGFGLFAGFANLVGSSAPFIIGALIERTGDFQAGLNFLVLSCIVTSFAMIPLMRRY